MGTELKLEHLAPYLPYGMNFDYKDKIMELTSLNNLGTLNLLFNGKICKPILRPLSDLTKEIEHNGERFVPADKFYNKKESYSRVEYRVDTLYFYYANESYWRQINLKDYDRTVLLISMHFDVFGLIDQGLAIDINTLENANP